MTNYMKQIYDIQSLSKHKEKNIIKNCKEKMLVYTLLPEIS